MQEDKGMKGISDVKSRPWAVQSVLYCLVSSQPCKFQPWLNFQQCLICTNNKLGLCE